MMMKNDSSFSIESGGSDTLGAFSNGGMKKRKTETTEELDQFWLCFYSKSICLSYRKEEKTKMRFTRALKDKENGGEGRRMIWWWRMIVLSRRRNEEEEDRDNRRIRSIFWIPFLFPSLFTKERKKRMIFGFNC